MTNNKHVYFIKGKCELLDARAGNEDWVSYDFQLTLMSEPMDIIFNTKLKLTANNPDSAPDRCIRDLKINNIIKLD